MTFSLKMIYPSKQALNKKQRKNFENQLPSIYRNSLLYTAEIEVTLSSHDQVRTEGHWSTEQRIASDLAVILIANDLQRFWYENDARVVFATATAFAANFNAQSFSARELSTEQLPPTGSFPCGAPFQAVVERISDEVRHIVFFLF